MGRGELLLTDSARQSAASARRRQVSMMKTRLASVAALSTLVTATLLAALPCQADVVQYESGVDPGVGFNLVSWGNFANGAQVWEGAVQAAFDAGFDEVSLSPIRFVETSSSAASPAGTIAAASTRGPELSHVAAGVARAKSLGMRVTVNPFVELKNGSNYFQSATNSNAWRGFYDPTPGSGEAINFWGDYHQYLLDVAQMAETAGADSLTVGTELRAITRNAGNNAQWNSLIAAVDGAFSGTLGYASNWDNYNHPNLAATIWDNPAIDFVGIDSYFPNLLGSNQADASGAYPNIGFITAVENAWNSKLDNEILPFAAARQGGAGLPVEFTEVGYLPRNRTTVTPQGESQPLDADEQNMAFEGLMRALDGRLASGQFLAAHVWQWDMAGSAGSAWNMNPAGGNQPANQQTAQWLSSFMRGSNPDPGVAPPQSSELLYSFESGLDGFQFPNYSGSQSTLATSVIGATDGNQSLAITKSDDDWTWDARVAMSGPQLQALQNALADGAENYVLEFDVSYLADALPVGLSDMNLHVSFDTDLDGWNQQFPFADISARGDQQFTVSIPLSSFDLSAGIASAALHFGFDGAWPNGAQATAYLDRVSLIDLAPDDADFNGDGAVDGGDFLAWQRGYGGSAPGDANDDGVVDAADLAVWSSQFGRVAAVPATGAIAEPAAASLAITAAAATGAAWLRRRRTRIAA